MDRVDFDLPDLAKSSGRKFIKHDAYFGPMSRAGKNANEISGFEEQADPQNTTKKPKFE